jgi:two-component system LytT family response regulator
MSLRILIIEDEAAAAERLARLLKEAAPEAEILQTLDSVEGALEWLDQNPAPDLILSDIELADGSSFEIFGQAGSPCPVIFTTAYDKYAIQAFKVNSVDYLLKPIKAPELAGALEKYRKLRQPAQQIDYALLAKAIREEQPSHQKRIVIRYGQNIKAIEISDAAYFFIESRVTLVVTKEGKRYPVDYNLDQLEGILDPEKFYRINRKMIVGIHAIESMYAYSKSRVKLSLKPASDQEAIVSTERSPHFKRWLTGE